MKDKDKEVYEVKVRNSGKKYANFSINIPTEIAKKLQLKNKQILNLYPMVHPRNHLILSIKLQDSPSNKRMMDKLNKFRERIEKEELTKEDKRLLKKREREKKRNKIKSKEEIIKERQIHSIEESIKNRENQIEEKIAFLIYEEHEVIREAKKYLNKIKKTKKKSSS